MDYLHGAGVVHGDLKSANVLLRSTATDARGFTCKLGDFGLSRLVDTGVHTHISTKTYGTVTYMPPEMLSKSRLTRAVDVYSFGILMWHLFTCQVPFHAHPRASRVTLASQPLCCSGMRECSTLLHPLPVAPCGVGARSLVAQAPCTAPARHRNDV